MVVVLPVVCSTLLRAAVLAWFLMLKSAVLSLQRCSADVNWIRVVQRHIQRWIAPGTFLISSTHLKGVGATGQQPSQQITVKRNLVDRMTPNVLSSIYPSATEIG